MASSGWPISSCSDPPSRDLRSGKAIVHGGRSQLFTKDSAKYVRQLGGSDIPIITVPEARHHLMLDQPLAFVTALRSVLALWDS